MQAQKFQHKVQIKNTIRQYLFYKNNSKVAQYFIWIPTEKRKK